MNEQKIISLGIELFTDCDEEVISYKGENFYKACAVKVTAFSTCVKRVNHPGVLHENYDGEVSTGWEGLMDTDADIDQIAPRPKVDASISDIASPDAPVHTNAQGGSQSDIPVRFDLIDAKAMFEMAKVLDHGARKYGADNWRLITVREHLNHLLMHTFAYLSGDETDDHLSHILCRATFAQGVSLQGPMNTPKRSGE